MQRYIVGNWKMNGTLAEAVALVHVLRKNLEGHPMDKTGVIICPPYPYLAPIHDIIAKTAMHVGAQDCYTQPKGAYTGEVSAPMLKDVGCEYVILGHSERRKNHHESDHLIREKIAAARDAGLVSILCVGESLEEREQGKAFTATKEQMLSCLPPYIEKEKIIIAYEPVWAIGTGKTATQDQVAEMHAFLKDVLKEKNLEGTPLIYGGSVTAENAKGILTLPHVDGVLVGGASLRLDEFCRIIYSSLEERDL